MSDEFNTVNIGRQQMARELEMLRQRYLGHRETLVRLEADAPSEELAASYRAVQQEIDRAVHKLAELTGGMQGEGPVRRTQPASARIPAIGDETIGTGAAAATAGVAAGVAGGVAGAASPRASVADRPLHSSAPASRAVPSHAAAASAPAEDKKRLIIIVAAAALMLAILAALVWRSRGNDTPTRIVEEQPIAGAETATEPPVESVADAGILSVNPQSHDFGVIRKGTRAVRQFRIENSSAEPLTVAIDRSTCRCLWFDFDTTVPPKSSSILAVTVDGAKAKEGRLDETVTIKNKADAEDVATIKLLASIE